MCEFCEGGKPIHECSNEGVDLMLIRKNNGSWVLDATGCHDGGRICGGVVVPIVACPMCGRKLKGGE